ncbi:type VII secretion integral membrane protein EccD [Corynebacterium vitaeruminis]|uniref:type VII secretion integral membrane protein EccD n=1 Tax=Corynebacterium vitaeruminis TaxID=38305 RepID=UPI00065FBBFB|nr:type VII secretion integral membrane protein EccD [Corynebacterium vitaeruminis]
MLGELIRVRIDAAHMPEDTNRAHADLALPTNVSIAALIPDILQIFDIEVADFPLAQWQLRTATGTILLADDTLNEAGISPGERLVVINDPGPVPKPRLFDAADAITDTTYTDGIGTADLIVGCTAALVATASIAAASLSLSSTDSTLAAAISFIALLAVAGGLRLALMRSARPAIVMVLELQVLVLAVTSGLCFVGLGLHHTLTDWPPTAAITVAFGITGLIFLILNRDDGNNRITATLGAGSLSTAVTYGIYATAVALSHNPVQSGALTAASAVILMLLAPSIAIKTTGIRVPKVPAAGESFDDSESPEISHNAPKRAGWLLDGIICGSTGSLSIFTLVVLFSGGSASRWWPLVMAVAVIVFCAIHSRGQARKVASTSTALAGLNVAVAVALQQWFEGNWPVSAGIVVPMLAATVLAAFPASRISPTTRRIAELTEACSIAVILPIAAIIAEFPEFVSGFFQ